MRKPQILISSSKYDSLNYERVVSNLTASGCEVILFEPDGIADGTRQFSMHITAKGGMELLYDNKELKLENIDAAWHRRPHYFGEHKDPLRWLSMKDEYGSIIKVIGELVPNDRWLNTARNMQQAGIKLPQLLKAAAHGFSIPETMISNRWGAIEGLDTDKLIVKLSELTILYPKNGRKTLSTTIIPRDSLPKHISSYPGIWQTYHEKKKEWRVTVVGDKIFSAAIYTDEEAKDDWRLHQEKSSVRFAAEDFPEDLGKKCVGFLKTLNLRYGAFDFIEQPDGEIIFLEVNPNGQFIWLEHALGLRISDAIADELLKIANKNSSKP